MCFPTADKLSALFQHLNIDCEKLTHPPLATALAADEIGLLRQGVRLKNLFLRDNYGRRHILLITAHNAQVDLKALSNQQQLSRLGFASNERLARYLKVRGGCVSMLALVNDEQNQVELWVDETVWQQGELFHCHPFDNCHTWLMSKAQLQQVFNHTKHTLNLICVPKR